MAAQLMVDIVTDASKAVTGFKKVDAAAEQTAAKTKKSGSALAGFGKALATGYAVTKVVAFGKASIDAADQAAIANKRLAQTFKDAGDSTGEAAKQAEDYAEALGRQIGVNPDVIKGAQAILTTFHSVSDASGRQAGIFNRATAAAADLAAAGYGDLHTNAIQLGKALQDPVKGTTALAKAGVNFSAAEKQQIATMVKHNDILGAQKIVLGEVESQVKGTAASTATAGAKMSVAFEEVKVKIGTALLPWVNKIKAVMVDLIGFMASNSDWLVPLIGGLVALVAVIKLVTGAVNVWHDAQALLDIVLDANPVTIIAIAIIALIAIVVLLAIKVKAVREIFVDVFNWIRANWPLLVAILLGPIVTAVFFIIKYWSTISGAIAKVWHDVVSAAASAVGSVVGFFGHLVGDIGRALSGLFNVITAPFRDAWNWISSHFVGPLHSALNGIGSAFNFLVGALKVVWNPIARALNAVHLSAHIPSNPLTKALHIDGKGFDWRPPWHLPTFARGGVFTRATVGVIGEAGTEIAAPEALLRQIVRENSGSNVTINVYVPPSVNPAEVGRQVVNSLKAYVRANGPIPGIAVA